MPKGNIVSHSDKVRAQLIALGVSQEVASRVNACSVLETDDNDKVFSEVLEMGNPIRKNGITRLKLTSISGSFKGGIASILNDPESLSTFLDGGMRGTPARKQIPLPDWVRANSRFSKQVALKSVAKDLVRGTAKS